MALDRNAFAVLLARAPEAYRHLAHVARDGWAWEFLRRGHGYQSAWRTDSRSRPVGSSAWDLCSFRRSFASI